MFVLLVGIAALVIQDLYKLDAEKVLTGGVYLKDGFRTMLLFGGLALSALGMIVTTLALAKPEVLARGELFVGVLVVAWLAAGGIAILVVGVNARAHDAQAASQPSDPAPTETTEAPPPQTYERPTPDHAADPSEPVTCGSGGCFQDSGPVYPVTTGDQCTTASGQEGAWQPTNEYASEFRCQY